MQEEGSLAGSTSRGSRVVPADNAPGLPPAPPQQRGWVCQPLSGPAAPPAWPPSCCIISSSSPIPTSCLTRCCLPRCPLSLWPRAGGSVVARGRCQELAAGFACLGTSIFPGHAASPGGSFLAPPPREGADWQRGKVLKGLAICGCLAVVSPCCELPGVSFGSPLGSSMGQPRDASRARLCTDVAQAPGEQCGGNPSWGNRTTTLLQLHLKSQD